MLPLSPFEKIAKKAGVRRISKQALEELRDAIEEYGLSTADKAVKLSKHAGRRTVLVDDVTFVTKHEKNK